MVKGKPTVGISWFLHKDPMPLWVNGATMNNAHLTRLFLAAGYRVLPLNAGNGDRPYPEMMLEQTGMKLDFIPIDEGLEQTDVLIECGAQISAEHVERVHKRGGKAIAYKFGNSYVLDGQRAISNQKSGSIFNGSKFDEIWTNAQHLNTCSSLWQTCYRAPVKCLPHIWEPCFIDAATREFPTDMSWGYKPGNAKKNIAIYEPNIDVVKMCYYPILACEEAYRSHPELVGDIYVTNALGMKEQESFRYFVSTLDIAREKKISFEGRYNTPYFQAKYADVCVTHQWENGLNYLYYDILYGGYPLIHNSSFLPDGVGYRYHNFDAQEAGGVLANVLLKHDEHAEEYRQNAFRFLDTVRATSLVNINAHVDALERLYNN